MSNLGRRVILSTAGNSQVARLMSRYGMRLGAKRFVCGEALDDAIQAIQELNRRGLKANATVLGEAVSDQSEATAALTQYGELIDRLTEARLRANLAVKLSLLGLDISRDVAGTNLRELLEHASQSGLFVRIDMESSGSVDGTLDIYRTMRQAGFDNVGVVLQSYLFRSESDLSDLLPLSPNLRIVKGAYLESPTISYARKADVDDAYIRLMERSLLGDGYTAIATHDERLIKHALKFTAQRGIARDRFEFQMLYGVRPALQEKLANRGYTVLVATVFGLRWYPFFMRRLAERPANVLFLARNIFTR